MIPFHSKIGQELRMHFEKLLNEYGTNELIPIYLENDTPNRLPEPRSEVCRNPQCERCRAVCFVPAPRAHVLKHVRVVPVHTGTF